MNRGKHTLLLSLLTFAQVVNALFETNEVDKKEKDGRDQRVFTMLWVIGGAVLIVGMPALFYILLCDSNGGESSSTET